MFRPELHEPGEQSVLGRRYPRERRRRRARRCCAIWLRIPSTAHFIATKLARHFIADEPPRARRRPDRCGVLQQWRRPAHGLSRADRRSGSVGSNLWRSSRARTTTSSRLFAAWRLPVGRRTRLARGIRSAGPTNLQSRLARRLAGSQCATGTAPPHS